LYADAWVSTHDLWFTAYITFVLCNKLLFQIDYEEEISNIYKIIDYEHAYVLNFRVILPLLTPCDERHKRKMCAFLLCVTFEQRVFC
jgi:hypothetical protein